MLMIGMIGADVWAVALLTGVAEVEDDDSLGGLHEQFEEVTDVDELAFPARK